MIENGGPLKRKLRDIHAEYELTGERRTKRWPADIFVKWDSYSEIIEVEASGSRKRYVTVNYSDVEDALGKMEYLEKNNMISPVESRSALRRVKNKSDDHAVTASYFRFRPLKTDTVHELLEQDWDIQYESPLERKLRLAKSSKNVVSFCVPLHTYRDVLKEIRRTPEMKVGLIYPFVEVEKGKFDIVGAIPVFQGIDLKERRTT